MRSALKSQPNVVGAPQLNAHNEEKPVGPRTHPRSGSRVLNASPAIHPQVIPALLAQADGDLATASGAIITVCLAMTAGCLGRFVAKGTGRTARRLSGAAAIASAIAIALSLIALTAASAAAALTRVALGALAAAAILAIASLITLPQVTRRAAMFAAGAVGSVAIVAAITLFVALGRDEPSAAHEVLPDVPSVEGLVCCLSASGYAYLNTRHEPDPDSEAADRLHDDDQVWVKCKTVGDAVPIAGGSPQARTGTWLRLRNGRYVYGAFIRTADGRATMRKGLPHCGELERSAQ